MSFMQPVRSAGLRHLAKLLETRTGQHVSAGRSWRIESALAPVLREWGISDVESLAVVVAGGGDPKLADRCVEAMLNNETSFFRDQASFALLTGPAINALREARATTRRLRIWSAACSTGQEALSLAISVLEEPEKWRGWTVEIIGTDVSAGAIAQARAARYSQFEIQRGLSVTHMLRYFRKDGDHWVAAPHLKEMCRFLEHNLLGPPAHLGRFDAILCRNMLMYLEPDRRDQVFDRLAGALSPDGLLMLGAAETVIGQTTRFVSSDDFRGLYTLTDSARPANF